MPIEEFYARSETGVVTFGEKAIYFSASLVKDNELADYEYARLGIDNELRRIYFAFQEQPAPGLPKFYQAGNSNRKIIAAGRLYSTYDWISDVSKEKRTAKKQFVLEHVDPEQADIWPKWKFYVTVGYSWSDEKDFQDSSQYPKEPGVYRLKKEGEVVRIGEGVNIAARLQEHLKSRGSEVDAFDFEIVPNAEERKKEERRLLDSFKAAIGRLPKFNPITR